MMNNQLSDALCTGFPLLDKATGGIKKGSLTIIKGGPCVGKMSLLLSLLLHSVRHGHTIGFFCNQYDLNDSIGRLYIMSELTQEEEDRILVCDSKTMTLQDFREIAEHMVRKGADVLFIHALESLDCENNDAILSRITNAKVLKALAVTLDVPVVATMMGGHDHSKKLQDGRSAIAPPSITEEFQDYSEVVSFADSVWLLHRPSAYRDRVDVRFIEDSPEYNTELMIAKNNEGAQCTIPMIFNRDKLLFEETGVSALPYSEEENMRLSKLIRPSPCQSLDYEPF